MRVIQDDSNLTSHLERDLKLLQLGIPVTTDSEPSEDCFCELTCALEKALEAIQRSFLH